MEIQVTMYIYLERKRILKTNWSLLKL